MIRVITAIVLGIAAIAAVWWLPAFYFDLIVLAAIAGSLYEYSRMMFADRWESYATIVFGSILAVCVVFVFPEDIVLFPLITLAFFLLAMFFMWRTAELGGVAGRIGVSAIALIYLAIGLSLWSWLRHLPLGREWVLLAIAPSCLCDTFAFLAGKMFGKHKLAPQVSPNKTIEGFFGAFLGSIIGAFAVYFVLLRTLNWAHVLIIALIIWILSPMGDLVESMMKRSAGVKDSGTIIPGHGGLLDRLDALAFTGAFVFAYVKYILNV
jgi:phosphatidate cytidylyltransferase